MKVNIKKILICLLAVSVISCVDENRVSHSGNDGTPKVFFDMTRASQDIINNLQVYMFDGQGSDLGQYRKPIPGITYQSDGISMAIEAGTWDFALVTAETNIDNKIISPVRGNGLSTVMWESKPENGELKSIPEIRTAYISQQLVLPHETNYANDVAMYRNVAKVRVYIEEANGLDANGVSTMELNGVPTTLNWEGKLVPNKKTPYVSASPMKSTFSLVAHESKNGYLKSNPIEFIIPAHKGFDFTADNPVDTTEHKLKLSVDLACLGNTRYKREDIVIPTVPRVNSILEVRISVGGKLEVTADVIDWEDEYVNADISHTLIQTDKASVGLAYIDTLYVNTNASDFTVDKDPTATWLTFRKLNNNAVELTANVDTYENTPRSSHITIKANNLTKKIPVTQRPDKGTISVSEKRLVFCPQSHEQRTVTITSIGGEWEFLDNSASPKATPNVQGGQAGTSNAVLTRTSTSNEDLFDKYYGDGEIVVRNKKTLDTETITLVNCYIHMNDNTIRAMAPSGTNQTAVTTTDDLSVYGGSKDLNFDSWSTWIHNGISWDPTSQKLTFTTDREKDDEAREGFMKFSHAECPDYVITARVYQDIIITIPPFHFMVIKYIWINERYYDVDTATEFAGNGATFDGKAVGWRLNSSVNYDNKLLMQWGGDAQNGEGETAFFNAPVLDNANSLPRKITLNSYSTWYTNHAGLPMEIEITAYIDGYMKKASDGLNYENVGGTKLYQERYKVIITTHQGIGSYNRGGYTHVATVTYDRIKHSADVKIHATIVNTRSATVAVPTPVHPDFHEEYKEKTENTIHTYSDDYTGPRK